jgi:hypothetical protein
MSNDRIPSPESLDSFGAHLFPARRHSTAARTLAALIALISWFAFVAQTDITINRLLARGGGVLDGLDRLTMYLTNLTILMSALCFTSLALSLKSPMSRFFRQPAVISAVVTYLAFVGIAYNLLLRHLWTPTGFRALVNESLHTVVPLLAIVYWIFRAGLPGIATEVAAVAGLPAGLPVADLVARGALGLLPVPLHRRQRARLPARDPQRQPAAGGLRGIDGLVHRGQPLRQAGPAAPLVTAARMGALPEWLRNGQQQHEKHAGTVARTDE